MVINNEAILSEKYLIFYPSLNYEMFFLKIPAKRCNGGNPYDNGNFPGNVFPPTSTANVVTATPFPNIDIRVPQ